MAISFLEDALIAEQTIGRGRIELYEPESKICGGLDYMVLDAQALCHLEIVESADGKLKGSLLHFVDHCSTLFGKRKMKKWLLAPLYNEKKINERLDAVEDLMNHQYETDKLRALLSKLPDLEKLLARVFTYSIKHSVEAIYFEDVSLRKMQEFRQLLNSIKSVESILQGLNNIKGELTSARLVQLISFEEEGGLLP